LTFITAPTGTLVGQTTFNPADVSDQQAGAYARMRKSDFVRSAQRQAGESDLEYANRVYRTRKNKTLREVADHVDLNSEYDAAGCLISRLASKGVGYSQVYHNGKYLGCHKVKYEAYFGSVPKGMVVRHTCHNRRCVNLAHLKVGTYKENSQDMVRSGRSLLGRKLGHNAATSGSRNRSAKLTEAEVLTIRQRLIDGERGTTLAKEYGVTTSVISCIKNRTTWKHI